MNAIKSILLIFCLAFSACLASANELNAEQTELQQEISQILHYYGCEDVRIDSDNDTDGGRHLAVNSFRSIIPVNFVNPPAVRRVIAKIRMVKYKGNRSSPK